LLYYPGPYFPNFLDDKKYMIFLLHIQIPGPHSGTRGSESPGLRPGKLGEWNV
jgi:hypothetical protein